MEVRVLSAAPLFSKCPDARSDHASPKQRGVKAESPSSFFLTSLKLVPLNPALAHVRAFHASYLPASADSGQHYRPLNGVSSPSHCGLMQLIVFLSNSSPALVGVFLKGDEATD